MFETEKDLLDELEEVIYVSDPVTYELYFVNASCTRDIGTADIKGKKCYELLQGRSAPCDFCTNSVLKKDGFLTWEHDNPISGSHFLVKDKLIDWNGREARLEIAININEHHLRRTEMQEILNTEQAVLDCLRHLTASENLSQAMDAVLSAIGGYYQADRAYTLEADFAGGVFSNTFEWCAPGVAPQKERRQNMEIGADSFWSNAQCDGKPIFISDLEKLRHIDPAAYRQMNATGIRKMMAVPFHMDEKGTGYLAVDNPGVREGDSSFLSTLSYFIINEMYRRRTQAALEYQSCHDALTGLHNRLSYQRDLEKYDGVLASVGVVYCDINGLKQINDLYGHNNGDQAIMETAGVLTGSFPDNRVYRLSGDEFFVLCPDVPYDRFIRNVRKAKQKFLETPCSVSIGFAWEDTDIDLALLTRHADEYMYQNKQSYYREHPEADTRKPDLLRPLLADISAGKFRMYLQPKADIHSGKIIGAEALIRYNDPEYGIVLPGKFIPLLESEKIIQYVDLFMFEEVCRTLAEWEQSGIDPVPISVNFSRITIMENRLIDKLREIMARYNVPFSLVEIEINESVGKIERQTIAEIGKSLKREGFALSLDDFGTSYSSMSMLTVVEPDIMKLDRSLIRSLTDDPKNQILIRSLVQLCEDLGIRSIAEGVETQEQLELLGQLNCNLAQGFLFSRPIPRDEFEREFLCGNQTPPPSISPMR